MDLPHRLKSALGAGHTLERELEAGGSARVFLAMDTAVRRRRVIRVLPNELAGAVSSERFAQAIQPATRLDHPYIVPLLSSGEVAGRLYYIMPFMPGEPLRGRLTRGGELPIPDALALLREVSAALAHAHEHGVVHRSLGPHNVFLSAGEVRVADLGIATALSVSTLGRCGGPAWRDLTLGPPAYRAPEESAGSPADLYSFGCLAYEILSGQAPFPGRSAAALLVAHAGEVPESIERRRPEVPPALATLVTACLAKRPGERPRSASEVAREIEGLAAGRTVGAQRA